MQRPCPVHAGCVHGPRASLRGMHARPTTRQAHLILNLAEHYSCLKQFNLLPPLAEAPQRQVLPSTLLEQRL